MNDTLEYEEQENDSSNSLNRNDIVSFNVERTAQNLVKWFENGKLIIPDFQRGFVWSKPQSSKFIDSILFGLPVPNLFFFREIKDGIEKYLLIDGQQRIRTLARFAKNTFSDKISGFDTSDFKINYKSSKWLNESIDSLNEDDRESFFDYPLTLTIFELKTKNKKKANLAMCEVFERINTGADKLSPQEIRHAVYSGECLDKIRKACEENPNYKELLSKDIKYLNKNCRMKDEELYLRMLSFYRLYTINKDLKENYYYIEDENEIIKIPSSKGNILSLYLDYSNDQKIDYNAELNSIDKALKVIDEFDTDAFIVVNREGTAISNKVHEVFAEALVISVICNNYFINISQKDFVDFKLKKWNSQEFYDLFVQDTISIKSVIKRVNYLRDVIKNGSN